MIGSTGCKRGGVRSWHGRSAQLTEWMRGTESRERRGSTRDERASWAQKEEAGEFGMEGRVQQGPSSSSAPISSGFRGETGRARGRGRGSSVGWSWSLFGVGSTLGRSFWIARLYGCGSAVEQYKRGKPAETAGAELRIMTFFPVALHSRLSRIRTKERIQPAPHCVFCILVLRNRTHHLSKQGSETR